jgi:hypothetical protein
MTSRRPDFVPRTPDFVNVRDAARELGLAPRTILARIRHGQIAAEKIGPGKTSAYIIARTEIARIKQEAAA